MTSALLSVYDMREAKNIAVYVMEEKFGKTKIREGFTLNGDEEIEVSSIMSRLLDHEPMQYVLGEAWFYGIKMKVDNRVLIPRPETEELVDLIISENDKSNPRILDIGTGSGCIAITLNKNISGSEVYALDISAGALDIARENAASAAADIRFAEADILQSLHLPDAPFDIIVSNPPYIDPAEKNSLAKNVIGFEPHIALFAKEKDPFIFYKAISTFAKSNLNPGGKLYFEIAENKGDVIAHILAEEGFSGIQILPDMQGKERMICAYL